MWLVSFALAALLGSIPFGLLVGRFKGIDVRSVGSGNIGATNVSRALGRPLGLLVLALDAGKGALAPLLFGFVDARGAPGLVAEHAPLFAAVLAVVGHCYSPWLRFDGGKGVATTLGAMLVLDFEAVSLALLVFTLIVVIWRRVSLASLCGAVALPVITGLLGRATPMVSLAGLLGLLVVVRHRGNLARLRDGTEHRIDSPSR